MHIAIFLVHSQEMNGFIQNCFFVSKTPMDVETFETDRKIVYIAKHVMNTPNATQLKWTKVVNFEILEGKFEEREVYGELYAVLLIMETATWYLL